jgi:hypothetical protein
LEIDAVLTDAYHAAAKLVAQEVKTHLQPFNLSRHPVQCHGGCLLVGENPFYDFNRHTKIDTAIYEAGEFVDRQPMPVRRLVGMYL